MDIEIEVVGKSNKWVLNQPLIRIGRGAKCEVALPANLYPSVAMEHVALEVLDQSVRLAGGGMAQGETYLNNRPAVAGSVVKPGDILRLGAQGPELRVHFQERQPWSAPLGHEPTRLVRTEEVPGHEPTRVVSVPLGQDSPPRIGYSGAGGDRGPISSGSPSAVGQNPRFAAPAGPLTPGGVAGGDWRERGQEAGKPDVRRPAVADPPPSTPAPAPANANLRKLEGKLGLMQWVLLANLALLVVLVGWFFQLNRQLTETRDEVRQLRVQAQSAVGQFMPTLDARLGVLDKRLDGLDDKLNAAGQRMEAGIDAKMKLAQDQMFTSLDAKMKATEERMVNRMNTEIPNMLDKYVNKKLTDLKH
jgi:hypothetical protein